MRTMIGVSIDSAWLRAVGTRGDHVLWTSECPRSPHRPPGDQLTDLLQPRVIRRRRSRVRVALGPTWAQTKALRDLPPVEDPGILTALVREEAGRFFRCASGGVTVSAVSIDDSRHVWVEAYDLLTVGEVERSCAKLGARLDFITSATRSLAAVAGDAHVLLKDGTLSVEASCIGGRLAAVRTGHHPGPSADHATGAGAPPVGSPPGIDSAYAVAWSVTRLKSVEPLCYRPRGHGSRKVTAPWRIRLAGGAFMATVAVALALPLAIARLQARAAGTELSELDGAWRSTARDERSLKQLEDVLDRIDAYTASRRSPVELLSTLTNAVPPTAAVVSLRVDSSVVDLVVLASRPLDVLNGLEEYTLFEAPRVIGPVTSERSGDRDVERLSIRAQLTHGVSR